MQKPVAEKRIVFLSKDQILAHMARIGDERKANLKAKIREFQDIAKRYLESEKVGFQIFL